MAQVVFCLLCLIAEAIVRAVIEPLAAEDFQIVGINAHITIYIRIAGIVGEDDIG